MVLFYAAFSALWLPHGSNILLFGSWLAVLVLRALLSGIYSCTAYRFCLDPFGAVFASLTTHAAARRSRRHRAGERRVRAQQTRYARVPSRTLLDDAPGFWRQPRHKHQRMGCDRLTQTSRRFVARVGFRFVVRGVTRRRL